MDINKFLEYWQTLPEEEQKNVFSGVLDLLGTKISHKIIKKGEKIKVPKGQVLINEGSDKPQIGSKSAIFIVLSGQLIARSSATESTSHVSTYSKADIIGIEMLINRLGQKNGHETKVSYQETVMAAFDDTEVFGLSIDDGLLFLQYNPKRLGQQLKHWMHRAIEGEQRMMEIYKVVSCMQGDLNLFQNLSQKVKELIELGEADTITGILLNMKKQLEAANDILQEYERDAASNQGKIKGLLKQLLATQEAFCEIMKTMPVAHDKVGEISDDEIQSVLKGI